LIKPKDKLPTEDNLRCLNATEEFKEIFNTFENDYYLYVPHVREGSWYEESVLQLYNRIYNPLYA